MKANNPTSRGKLLRAAALLGVISLEALAQVAPLPGGGTVTITSPPSGARVGGTITVSASATAPFGVSGVQFKLDDVDLGTEDTTAPYSASWDTTTASDGWHKLTAVARDASGQQVFSDPVTVTVSNTPPPHQAVKRYEETDAAVTYSAGWQSNSGWPWSGGTSVQSRLPGAKATFAFTGTSVTWVGYRSRNGGIARVFVDGIHVSDIDLFARQSNELRAPAFTMSGLTNDSHTLTVEVTGLKNDNAVDVAVVVDAFDVPGPPVSRLQESDPSISYTTGWTEDLTETSTSWSGSNANVSTTPGAQATLTFNGTSIEWIGYRGPDAGIARVFLDGSLAGEVDTYSPTRRFVDSLFTATGLADSSHTLTIEVTGLKNAASTGTFIAVDAFDVTTPGTRFEDTDWSITYAGNWNLENRNHAWTQGTIAASNTAGSQATFTFTGTAVSWIGRRGPYDAIARVYLDGAFVAEVDNYAPTHGFQDTLFTVSGLVDTTHTLTIEVTGRKNPATTLEWPWVSVDAFDVRRPAPETAPPPSPSSRLEESAASYTGTWTSYGAETGTFSGGTVLASPNAMDSASFSFTGSAVTWIGVKCSLCGIATVSIDGGAPSTVNTAGPTGSNLTSEPVFSASGLDPATAHTMVITVTGTTTSGGAHIAVDAFDVTR